jgi:serine/threonine-protein kinase PpkA
MFCDKCGSENREGAEFCTHCGLKLPKENITISPAVQASPPQSEDNERGGSYIELFKQAVSKRYEIIRQLGRGGMAVVYLARDNRLERDVAMKLLPQELTFDENFAQRFIREARISAKLSHPNIIQIHDVDSESGFYYYTMAFIDGVSLGQIIRQKGALNPRIIARLGIQVCFALQHAHEKGVIHRDIKPENILINKKRQPIVVDFGIAKAITDTKLSVAGAFIGTPQYMSPEQIKGDEVDSRSDIYSLGCLLYEMAVGRPPFNDSEHTSLIYKQVHSIPDSPHAVTPEVPAALSGIIMQALAKNPKNRPQSAAELGKMLHEAFFAGTASAENHLQKPESPASAPNRMDSVPEQPVREKAESTVLMPGASPDFVRKKRDDTAIAPSSGENTQVRGDFESKGNIPHSDKNIEQDMTPPEKKGKKRILYGIIGTALLGITALVFYKAIPSFLHNSQPEQRSARVVIPEKKQAQQELEGTSHVQEPSQSQKNQESQSSSTGNASAMKPDELKNNSPEPIVSGSVAKGEDSPNHQKIEPKENRNISPATPQKKPAPSEPPKVVIKSEPVKQEERIIEKPVQKPAAKVTAQIIWMDIPGGTFTMGENPGDNGPAHTVTVSSFEISRDEITVKQYAVFLASTGHEKPLEWETQIENPERPVVFVSWYDAAAFAKWAGGRLPAEAEWEYGAKGAQEGAPYPWGNDSPEGRANYRHPFEKGAGWTKYLMKPGMFPPNRFGLNDMAGNVWEWCEDWDGKYTEAAAVNPSGPSAGQARIIRGGAWNSGGSQIRTSMRGRDVPSGREPHIGFRIARGGKR